MSQVKEATEKSDGDAPFITGEVPQDLRGAGWELKEHVDEAGSFKCVNKTLKLGTSPTPTAQLAFEAARRIQKKHKGPKGGAVVAVDEKVEPRGAIARRFTQTLKVRLSPDGLQEKCEEYDARCAELEEIEKAFKLIHDRHKEDVREKQAEVDALQRILRKQSVESEVDCEERLDYDAKMVRVFRLDTKEVVVEREMKPEELQQRLIST